ncbi:MarR family transcriptional regulator, partial [Streptomyces sp. C1-2]|nr:MarR family transcriptional regulator [Streptomyces sp. C1-2]
TLESVAPAHVASVRRHFIDRLSPEDLRAVERIAQKLEDIEG